MRVAPSGRVHVYTGAVAMGQGTRTMLAQVVAEHGLAPIMHNISVSAGDTAGIAMGLGGFNSRQAVMAGTSAHLAAVKVRDKALLEVGSHMLEVAADDLEIDSNAIRVEGRARACG